MVIKGNFVFIFICLELLIKAIIYRPSVSNPVVREADAETELGMQGLYWEKDVCYLWGIKGEAAALDEESLQSGMLMWHLWMERGQEGLSRESSDYDPMKLWQRLS